MSEANLTHANKRLEMLRQAQGKIPWYRRNAFIAGALAALVAYALLLLPVSGDRSAIETFLLGAFCASALAWAGLILSDTEKPEWVKTLVAFGLLFLAGWLFYRYTDTEWDRLGHVFFNWDMMRDTMEGGSTGWSILFAGFWLTVQIAFFSGVFGTLIGLFLAIFRSFNNRILNIFIIAYIDFFRSMPIIVLMALVYYALPYTGITLSAMVSGILALSLNSSAYISEIFRAGISAIHHGQIEAAHALGLNSIKTMRLIILPQAFRVVIPPLASNYVASAKDTAVCSAISILELLKAAMQLQAWRANPTPLIAATAIYIIFFVPLTRLAGVLENRMKARQAR
jgi:polar amino acid transport system permease protein